jgi:ubiquinone/menaquinone biosynthesis C-methylase UbiE
VRPPSGFHIAGSEILPILASMSNQPTWDEVQCQRYADAMRKLAPYDHRGVAARIAKHLGGLRAGAVVVDAASGPGFLGFELAKLLNQPKLVLIDSAVPMLQVAREEARNAEIAPEVIHCPVEQIALADGAADVVTCKNLMNCIDADARTNVARELYRLVAPGGKAFIVDFDERGSRLAAAAIGLLVRLIAGKTFQSDFRAAVGRRLDPSPLVDSFEAMGASVSVERFGPSFLLVAHRAT